MSMEPDYPNKLIEGNCSLFLAHNSKRREHLFDRIGLKNAEMLQTIPFLLHVNRPGTPGYIDHPLVIYGTYDFTDTPFWGFSLNHFRLEEKTIGPWLSRIFHIRGLYLMGCTGMVTGKMPPDLNYWIIIDKKRCSSKQVSILKRKIEAIQSWCRQRYGYRILFSLLDVSDFRNNNFSSISDDIPGTVQQTLLKEEFYRTYIFISGKIPFWSVCPAGTGDATYHQLKELAGIDKNLTGETESRYIDLGPVSHIDNRECPDAALWQIYRARKNPAEALIKAALIASYNFSEKGVPLPCDKLKERIVQNRGEQTIAEPNTIVFEEILAFAKTTGNTGFSEALRESIYLSLSGYPTPRRKPDEVAGRLLNEYMALWNWSPQKMDRFRTYEQWLEQEMFLYEHQLVKKIAFVYELVLRSHEDTRSEGQTPETDKQVLFNTITAFFKKKPGRIPSVSTFLKTCSHKKNIGIQCDNSRNGEAEWSIYETSARHTIKRDRLLYKGPELLKVVAWMVTNGFFRGDFNRISFHLLPKSLEKRTIKKLTGKVFKYLTSQAEPVAVSESPVWEKMIVVLIPDGKHAQKSLLRAEVLLCNTWHELYFNKIALDKQANLSARCYAIAEYIAQFISRYGTGDLSFEIVKLENTAAPDPVRLIKNFIKTLSFQKSDYKPTAPMEEEDDSDEIKPFLDIL